jgi:hypothetical protein
VGNSSAPALRVVAGSLVLFDIGNQGGAVKGRDQGARGFRPTPGKTKFSIVPAADLILGQNTLGPASMDGALLTQGEDRSDLAKQLTFLFFLHRTPAIVSAISLQILRNNATIFETRTARIDAPLNPVEVTTKPVIQGGYAFILNSEAQAAIIAAFTMGNSIAIHIEIQKAPGAQMIGSMQGSLVVLEPEALASSLL